MQEKITFFCIILTFWHVFYVTSRRKIQFRFEVRNLLNVARNRKWSALWWVHESSYCERTFHILVLQRLVSGQEKLKEDNEGETLLFSAMAVACQLTVSRNTWLLLSKWVFNEFLPLFNYLFLYSVVKVLLIYYHSQQNDIPFRRMIYGSQLAAIQSSSSFAACVPALLLLYWKQANVTWWTQLTVKMAKSQLKHAIKETVMPIRVQRLLCTYSMLLFGSGNGSIFCLACQRHVKVLHNFSSCFVNMLPIWSLSAKWMGWMNDSAG